MDQIPHHGLMMNPALAARRSLFIRVAMLDPQVRARQSEGQRQQHVLAAKALANQRRGTSSACTLTRQTYGWWASRPLGAGFRLAA